MFEQYKEQLIKITKVNPTVESIAIVTKDDRVIHAPNISKEPSKSFKLSTRHLEDLDVKFIFHSHVSDYQPGALSFKDIVSSKKWKIPFLVYHTIFDEWDYFDPEAIHPYPIQDKINNPRLLDYYLNWIYSWGRCDCYTVLRAYYKGVLGIELDDFSRGSEEEAKSPTWNRFRENFEQQGFHQVKERKYQKNDLLLFNTFGNPNGHHVGVYLGDAKFLHLLWDREPSKVEQVTTYYVNRLVSVWRHKDVS